MAARDFKPISLLAKVPSLYVVHPDVRAKNLKKFVALAGSKPGQLNDGSAGNDSAGHLTFKYLKIATGIFILHASYRGTDPPLTDLLVGRLQAAAVGAPAIFQYSTGAWRPRSQPSPADVAPAGRYSQPIQPVKASASITPNRYSKFSSPPSGS